jgi:hypothetical protein
MPAMADWRQIQARIRKAKNSTDARTKLNELYQRTRDAMVSWELAAVEEKAEHLDEAIKWYTISAERFRRADWKKKAEDALTRLGAPIPAPGDKSAAHAHEQEKSEEGESNGNVNTEEPRKQLAVGEIAMDEEDESDETDDESEDSSDDSAEGESQAETLGGAAANGDAAQGANGKKKRRRGRRGGRGRRRKGASPTGTALPAQAFAENRTPAPAASAPAAPTAAPQHSPRHDAPNFRSEPGDRRPSAYAAEHDHAPRRTESEPAVPMLPSERTAHGRAGDPALASRMAKLDSMLRRLVASPLHKMDDVDSAPAGPGVFLLSDSDQITSYYVESCQTLRVGLGNLVRGGSRQSAKPQRGPGRPNFESSSGLKSKLAEHLGIGEAKVSQYLKDHCVVRWIQLDDDAPHLAHFAIGVLRTPLNAD